MSSPQQKGGIAGAFHGLAIIAGLFGMIFLTPRLWPLIQGRIWAWLIDLYSYEAAWWLHLGFHIAAWLFTFLAIRLGLSVAVAGITLLLIRRRM